MAQREVSLDVEAQSREVRERLADLLDQVVAQGSTSANPHGRDVRTYELAIERDNGTTDRFEQSDGAVTPEFAELMRLIRANRA
ncbi:hypothetical protein F183_A43650 [Bryobacterales bacterium F-183]|nr:hypothetical protein F183_A43650 [Bryobacterales bacterium F-183]